MSLTKSAKSFERAITAKWIDTDGDTRAMIMTFQRLRDVMDRYTESVNAGLEDPSYMWGVRDPADPRARNIAMRRKGQSAAILDQLDKLDSQMNAIGKLLEESLK